MKYKDFEQRVINKLFITTEDAINYQYFHKIKPLLNECLNFIANGDLPMRASISHFFGRTVHVCQLPSATEEFFEVAHKYTYEVHGTFYKIIHNTDDDTYEWIETTDPLWYEFEEYNVISVEYADTEIPGANFYVRSDVNNKISVKVNKPGKYTFICNCEYPEIPITSIKDGDDDKVMALIPNSVLSVAVLYVASQLLFDFDQPRAQMVRNEYEIALARLDTQRQDKEESFKICDRW